LTRDSLVAIQAIDALPRVSAHFELMNDGILQIQVAFGAFASRFHKRRIWLLELGAWASRMQKIRGNDKSGGDDNCDEHSTESHGTNLLTASRIVKG
jgi:hypothetical protein